MYRAMMPPLNAIISHRSYLNPSVRIKMVRVGMVFVVTLHSYRNGWSLNQLDVTLHLYMA